MLRTPRPLMPHRVAALARGQRAHEVEDPDVFKPAAGAKPAAELPGTVTVPFVNRAFTIPAASAIEIAAAKPDRRYLLIQNNSAAIMYVAFGQPASNGGDSIQIAAGGYYESPAGICPANSINVFGTGNGVIVEG